MNKFQNKHYYYSCSHSKSWNQETETSQTQRDLNDVFIKVKKNKRQENITKGFELQIDASELLILSSGWIPEPLSLRPLNVLMKLCRRDWRLPGQTGTGPAGTMAAPGMSSLSLFYSAVTAAYIKLITRIYRTFYLIELLW